MRNDKIRSFVLLVVLAVSTYSCFAVQTGLVRVPAALQQSLGIERVAKTAIVGALWVAGTGISLCARNPRTTLLAGVGLLWTVRPVRRSIIDYTKTSIVGVCRAAANSVQNQIRNYILGSMPQMLSETQKSVELHTQKLDTLATDVQLVGKNVKEMQVSLNRLEHSIQNNDAHVAIVQQQCNEMLQRLESQHAQLNALKSDLALFDTSLDTRMKNQLGEIKQWFATTENAMAALEQQLGLAKKNFSDELCTIGSCLSDIQTSQQKQVQLLEFLVGEKMSAIRGGLGGCKALESNLKSLVLEKVVS